jgi:hypothetical protein
MLLMSAVCVSARIVTLYVRLYTLPATRPVLQWGFGGLLCCDVVVYHHPGNEACLPVTTP